MIVRKISLGRWVSDSPSQLVLARILATMFSFVTGPLIARSLGTIGRGETAAILALFYLVPILVAFGVPMEVRRLVSAQNELSVIRTYRSFALYSTLIAALVAAAGHFLFLDDFQPSVRVIAMIGILACPITILWMCDISVLVALGKYRDVSKIQLVQPLIYMLLILILLVSHFLNVETVLVAYLVSNLAAGAWGYRLTQALTVDSPFKLPTLLRGSLKFSGSSIAEAASNRLDQILMVPIAGAAQAGIYSVAVTITAMPIVLGQALGATFFRQTATSSGIKRAQAQTRALSQTAAISIVVFPILALGSFLAIPILFGNEFRDSIPVALILSLVTSFQIYALVCSMLLAARGRGWIMTVSQVVSLIVAVILLIVLGPLYGAIGAAISALSSAIILTAILLFGSDLYRGIRIPTLRNFIAGVRSIIQRS